MNQKELKELERMLVKSATERWPSMEDLITAIGGSPPAHDDPVRVMLAELAGARPRTPTPVPAGAASTPTSVPSNAAPTVPQEPPAPEPEEPLHTVRSPIVGTFYEAPSPGAPPFVKVGDLVEVGQVLCIVEAMKLMNEIESDVAGEVVKKLVANGQPIEYGQELFAIRQRK